MNSFRTLSRREHQRGVFSKGLAGNRAFTFVELLVVIAVVALLASLMVPALARTRPTSQSVRCLNNHRQLVSAWKMYASDYNDRLLVADSSLPNRTAWIAGNLDFSANSANWDTNVNIVTSPLWPYMARQAAILKCPADPSFVIVTGQIRPRVRSVSMSHVFGNGAWLPPNTWRTYDNGGHITVPARTFVFLDEHPDSLSDGAWANTCTGAGSTSGRIVDFPASYHNGGCSFSFTDGRAEIHKWLDSRTKPPIRSLPIALNVSSPNNPDVLWLAEHTTVRR